MIVRRVEKKVEILRITTSSKVHIHIKFSGKVWKSIQPGYEENVTIL